MNKCEYIFEKGICEEIRDETCRTMAVTGEEVNTVLLSEEFYGALIYEIKVKEGRKGVYMPTHINGLKIKRCKGQNVMIVYKEV